MFDSQGGRGVDDPQEGVEGEQVVPRGGRGVHLVAPWAVHAQGAVPGGPGLALGRRASPALQALGPEEAEGGLGEGEARGWGRGRQGGRWGFDPHLRGGRGRGGGRGEVEGGGWVDLRGLVPGGIHTSHGGRGGRRGRGAVGVGGEEDPGAGGERGRGPPGLGEVGLPGGGTATPATKLQGPRLPGGVDLGPVIMRAGAVAPGGGGDVGFIFDRSRIHDSEESLYV